MYEAEVIDFGRRAMLVALQISLPVLLFGLVAGVLISIFQAVTQIQEMTLSFVPKILAIILALFIFGPWMFQQIVGFTEEALQKVPSITSR